MFALDAASRTVVAATAFAAFGAAFVTTPFVARGEGGVLVDPTPSVVSPRARPAVADVVPRRDPFAGGDAPVVRPDAPLPHGPIAMPMIAPLPQIPAALHALPPNAGAADATFPFATGTHTGATVTAVITGAHPFALVDEGGTTRVLTVGDRLGGESIVAIDANGVRLSGGTLLAVARASEPVPPQLRPISGGR
jgi:hypothetical protein